MKTLKASGPFIYGRDGNTALATMFGAGIELHRRGALTVHLIGEPVASVVLGDWWRKPGRTEPQGRTLVDIATSVFLDGRAVTGPLVFDHVNGEVRTA